jgi:hypothetical protein
MDVWTRHHEEIKGAFYLKCSVVGLCSVFQCNVAELSRVTVEGDLVVSENEGIVTRSKAKRHQHSILQLRPRILQLLAREYQATLESGAGGDDDEAEDAKDIVRTLLEGSSMSQFVDSSLLDFAEDDGDEQEQDLEIVNDPVNQIDLQVEMNVF